MEDLVAPGMPSPLADDLERALTPAEGLWKELRGARVFVTGGTGFFGSWLLEAFLWACDRYALNASIVVLTRNPSAFSTRAPHLAAHPSMAMHLGDVRQFDFPPGSFTHVIHAATDSGTPLRDEDRLLMFDTIVAGTRRTLEFARHAGARRFLLTSSGAVYGRQPADLTHVPEDYGGAPESASPAAAYAEGKRAAETLCALHADAALQPTIARCFAFVGPYLPVDAHFAVGNFIRDALHGGPIRVSGDGTPYRSYLYAADLAVWLWTILLRGQPMRPYNVGSEVAISIGDLAHVVARHCTPTAAVSIDHAAPSGRLPERYVPNTTRARSELGVSSTIDLEGALTRTLSWHRRRTSSPYVVN